MRKIFYKALMASLILAGFISKSTYSFAEVYTTLSGYVTLAENGQPIANVEVYAVKQATEETVLLKATTDSKGLYVINRVPSGAYKVYIRPGTDYWWDGIGKDVTVPVGKNVLNVNFKVDKSASVSGKVIDQNGNSLVDVEVLAQNPNKGVIKVSTDANGNYKLSGLNGKETGIVGIIAKGVGSIYKEGISLSQGSTSSGIDFSISKMQTDITLTGIVSSTSGLPVKEAIITVFSEATRTIAWTTTDEQGKYILYSLPTGNFDIKIIAIGYGITDKKGISILKGQPTTLDFQLFPQNTSAVSNFLWLGSKTMECVDKTYEFLVPDVFADCQQCNLKTCSNNKADYDAFKASHQNDAYSLLANALTCVISDICYNTAAKKYSDPNWVTCTSDCLHDKWKKSDSICWNSTKTYCNEHGSFFIWQYMCADAAETCHWGEDLQICQGSGNTVCGKCNDADVSSFRNSVSNCMGGGLSGTLASMQLKKRMGSCQ